MVRHSLSGALLCAAIALASPASAEDGVAQSLGIRAGASLTNDADVAVGYQARLGESFRLGLTLQGARYSKAFVSALAVEDGLRGSVTVPMAVKIDAIGPMKTHVLLAPKIDAIEAPSGSGLETGIGVGGEAGVLFHIRVGAGLKVEAGIVVPFRQEISPESINDKNGVLLPAGLSWQIDDRWSLDVLARIGPVSGGNGDTAKFLAEAAVGLRFGADPDALLFF